jgi:L-ascorbate metabolism protein UlaG (beta-lactamase superfamily)
MLGYAIPMVEADVVTNSHTHLDHNYLGGIRGNFLRIAAPGDYAIKDVAIRGITAFHDNVQGKKRGPNIVFRFVVDGISICHCGDLGHQFDPAQIEALGKIDVLLLPVGGMAAISVPEAVAVRQSLRPTITVPMHFRTRAMGLFGLIFAPVSRFLDLVQETPRRLSELSLDAATIGSQAGIVVLDYK